MKIVHVTASLAGGSGIATLSIHRALLAQGVDSRVLIAGPSGPAAPNGFYLQPSRRPLRWRILRRFGLHLQAADRWETRLSQAEKNLDKRKAIESVSPPFGPYHPQAHPWIEDADIVNLHWVARSFDFRRFMAAVRTPLLMTLHDQYAYLGARHYAGPVESGLERIEKGFRVLKSKAYRGKKMGVIGNSEWNTAEAAKSGMFPVDTRFRTIYYPLDTGSLHPREKASAKIAFGIEPARFVIGFACDGLSNYRKGFDLLLDALGLLPPSILKSSALLTFGRHDGAEQLAAFSTPHFHMGHIESDALKAALYSAMDVFVVPSRAEAFGLTAIESLACGTPVIASKVGGLVEAVGDGGLLCEPENSHAIAEAVARLYGDPHLRESLGQLGPSLANERHSAVAIGRNYWSFAAEIIARGSAPHE